MRLIFAAFALLFLCISRVSAQPYVPANGEEVLEILPASVAQRKVLKRLRADREADPNRPEAALALARHYLRMGRIESDPRHYAHAEAVLQAWLKPETLHPEALVLRATVLQNRHEFEAALADLRSALRMNPGLPQAWLTRAAIEEARGDSVSALTSCMALAKYASGLAGPACIYSALGRSGQAGFSYQRLSALVSQTEAGPEELQWARGILAEMAERLGQPQAAEAWYRLALDSDTRSVYLMAAYADFLLAHNRPGDVLVLLQGQIRPDPLLLRLTLAEQRLHHADFASHSAMLQARFAAAKARGDTTHQGDQARFYTEILNQPEAALRLASANWEVQREPRDAIILLEAAVAAGQSEAARPVREFIAASHLEDVRLSSLLRQSNEQTQASAVLLSNR